jgi:thiosulfate/3-mercaptopyruvate sulfurtransferase
MEVEMKKNILVILVIGVLLMAVGCSNTVNDTEAPEVAETKEESDTETEALTFEDDYLVTKDWLNDNLDNENLLILDARGEKAYSEGHIPGAIATSWQSFSNMEGAPGDMGWGVVKEASDLSEIIAALGIDQDKKIVVYTDVLNGWGEDARVFWTLEMAGLNNVRILDGGYNLWEDSDLGVSKDTVQVEKSTLIVETLDRSASIDFNTLKDNYDTYVVIDTRNKDEYEGATNFGEARGGHLPEAIHFNFSNVLNEDGTFKDTEVLEEIFSAAGLEKEDKIVTYCTAGIRSAHLQVALEMAGYENAQNYDASFYEWSGNDEVSVEK